jgi:hypothetical protein
MKLLLGLLLSFSLFAQTYNRSEFGDGWATYEGCINVRERVLILRSAELVGFDSTGCKIAKGLWLDPYSGMVYKDPNLLDIDHVVPLKWAWIHGASKWDRKKRVAFANHIEDPKHLLPVAKKLNISKSDRGPDRWLPSVGQCSYIVNFDRIVKIWQLEYSSAEKEKIESLKKFYCGLK